MILNEIDISEYNLIYDSKTNKYFRNNEKSDYISFVIINIFLTDNKNE